VPARQLAECSGGVVANWHVQLFFVEFDSRAEITVNDWEMEWRILQEEGEFRNCMYALVFYDEKCTLWHPENQPNRLHLMKSNNQDLPKRMHATALLAITPSRCFSFVKLIYLDIF
jgi:hypothetical protein